MVRKRSRVQIPKTAPVKTGFITGFLFNFSYIYGIVLGTHILHSS